MDSSPFVERPKSFIESPVLEVNTLKFQLKDLENQLALERLQHEEAIEALTKELTATQKKADELSGDQLHYYEAHKELKVQLEAEQKENKDSISALQKENQELKADLTRYKDLYEDLRANDDHELSVAKHKKKSLEAEIQKLQEMNEEFVEEVQKQVEEVRNLRSIINERDEEIDVLHSKIHNMPSANDIEETTLVSKKLAEQVEYIQELEQKNLAQSEQIKQLHITKTNSEILKNENTTLKAKLAKVDELNDVNNDLNMELLQLKQERNKWKIYLDEDDDVKIEEFVKGYKALKNESLLLKSNFGRLESELKESKYKYNELFVQHETLQKNMNALTTASDALTKLNVELEQQRDLAFEESTFLREQLKNLDTAMALNESDKDKYVANLESSVEEYKSKIEKLTKENTKEVSNKRHRSEVDDDEDTMRNFQNNISSLEQSNFDLENQVTRLMNENALLIKKLESIEDIKEQKIRILQLRNNPFMKDQLVKREQLEVLKRENDDLLKKATFTETVPLSVYESLQLENQELERKIHELNKRIQRLREIFADKSREFVDAINSVLGYNVEFQKTGKLTLRSKFSDQGSLVIDPVNMTLKKHDMNEGFDTVCDRLIDFWIRERENLPCFLAALTLELNELGQSAN